MAFATYNTGIRTIFSVTYHKDIYWTRRMFYVDWQFRWNRNGVEVRAKEFPDHVKQFGSMRTAKMWVRGWRGRKFLQDLHNARENTIRQGTSQDSD